MIKDRRFCGRRCKSFTLQWHLTNACPFCCRHCYDRSDRQELGFPKALEVLSDLRAFCRRRRVEARLSLSGGDPLLCSYFWELYQAIADARLPVSILGNPVAPGVIRSRWRLTSCCASASPLVTWRLSTSSRCDSRCSDA